MEYLKQPIPLPRDFPFDMYKVTSSTSGSPNFLHCHDSLEINYFLNGSGRNVIEDVPYKIIPGDIYIINNFERHFAFPDAETELIVIVFNVDLIWQGSQFDYEYIKTFYNRGRNFSNCIRQGSPVWDLLSSILNEMWHEWNAREEGYKLVIKALLMKMLAALYRHFGTGTGMKEDISVGDAYYKIRDVIEYINNNFQEEITLDRLAEIAHMNRNYLSSYFKRAMTVNFHEYLQRVRIGYACMQLKSTGKSILEISDDSGFKNVTYFNRVFKKLMKCTPYQYRSSEM